MHIWEAFGPFWVYNLFAKVFSSLGAHRLPISLVAVPAARICKRPPADNFYLQERELVPKNLPNKRRGGQILARRGNKVNLPLEIRVKVSEPKSTADKFYSQGRLQGSLSAKSPLKEVLLPDDKVNLARAETERPAINWSCQQKLAAQYVSGWHGKSRVAWKVSGGMKSLGVAWIVSGGMKRGKMKTPM